MPVPTIPASPAPRAETERDRAERSRDRAISAVGLLLRNDNGIMLSEELRPYRKALIDAGLKESVGLVQDLEGDPRAEVQRLDAYIALSKLQHDGGDPAGAASTIGKAVALAESLLARDPSSAAPVARWRRPFMSRRSSCRTSRHAANPPGGPT